MNKMKAFIKRSLVALAATSMVVGFIPCCVFAEEVDASNQPKGSIEIVAEPIANEDYSESDIIGDDDYDRVDENETQKMRKEIKQKYDKDAHYMFLLDEFFSNLKEKRNEYLSYEKTLYSFVEEGDEDLFEREFTSNDFLSVIQEYNDKRG